MVTDRVAELVQALEPLDAEGRVYAELAETLADRIDASSRPAQLVRELRAVLMVLTSSRREGDALLQRLFADD